MDASFTGNSWNTDWTKCCLCQEVKKEDLKSPQASPARRGTDGYMKLATNIPLFHSLNALPIKLGPARFDEGGGIKETLRQKKELYHESCRLLFNNTKLSRAEKRSTSVGNSDEGSRSKIPQKVQEAKAQECLFCGTKEGELREAMAMQVNKRIKECAKTISDKKLLAKVIAQELKYHPACLVALYNEERAYLKAKEQEKAQEHWKEAYPIAFSELVTYISEMKNASDSRDPVIFKLADLTTLYKQRLEQLGVELPDVHSTRLKDQLLFHIPKMQAHGKGRDVLLAFEDDVGSILSQSSKYCEVIHLAKAAEIIRRDMLHHKSNFSSTFHDTDL